jgi:hypothetical protein
MKLEDRKWKEFYIKDIFIIENKKKIQVPTGAYIKKKELFKSCIPRITVTSENNGIDSFSSSEHKNYRTYENFISVSFLGTIFYHEYKASIDMKVHCLQLVNKVLNPNLAEFLVAEIKKSLTKASYGNQISSTDLPHKKLLLPININNYPDWQFMEDYIKYIIKNKRDKYKIYYTKILDKLKYKNIMSLKEQKWKEFFITDIFNTPQRGKRLTKAKQIIGNIPYISSTASNKGIDNFIANDTKVRSFENCLTIANSGSVGASFYHKYRFIASDHVTHLQKDNINEYVYLFISVLTNRFKQKYNFNREINDKRISKEKILLPINKKNEPDYDYMEQYIKNIKYKKLKQYRKS